MAKVFPVLLIVLCVAAGAGAGLFLRPDQAATDQAAAGQVETCAPTGDAPGTPVTVPEEPSGPSEFVKFSNQFVIPLLGDQTVEAMVILSLSLEVPQGEKENVYAQEPRLRDAFLRVLFDHANSGGFSTVVMTSAGLDDLRAALREAALKHEPDAIRDVLIADLVRQEI